MAMIHQVQFSNVLIIILGYCKTALRNCLSVLIFESASFNIDRPILLQMIESKDFNERAHHPSNLLLLTALNLDALLLFSLA